MINIRKPKIFFFGLYFITIAVLTACYPSQNHTLGTHENRISLIIKDTSIQFYLWPVEKKIDISISDEKYYTWYMSGHIQVTKGNFEGRVLEGSYLEFYPNRQLKVKGRYKKGLKTGLWESWFINGELESKYEWWEGLKNGPYTAYNLKGEKIKEGTFENGRENNGTIETALDSSIQKK